MNLGIAGRRALVTGSSAGMGRNIALALAAEGVDLVLFSRNEDKLGEAASEIREKHGVTVTTHAGSMTSPQDIAALIAHLRHTGGLDIAVLVSPRPPTPLRPSLEETDSARWQLAYDNQLASVIGLVNGLGPLLQERGWGRLIAITSAHAKQPVEGHALSSVFRAGVTAYMKGLAAALGPFGVTVNCVAPALIETPHRQGAAAYTAEQTQHRSSLSPLGRLGTQEEVCAVVGFLASQQAGFITGSSIVVDGGMGTSLF